MKNIKSMSQKLIRTQTDENIYIMSHVLFLLTGGLLNKVGGGGGAAGEQATKFNFLGSKIGGKRRIT